MKILELCICLTLLISFLAADSKAGEESWAVRVNCGAEEPFKDKQGRTWLADKESEEHVFEYVGGMVLTHKEISIKNTDIPELYRCKRYKMRGYCFYLKNGYYTVRLHFAETWSTLASVFDVKIEGKTVLNNFKPMEEAGGRNIAMVKEFPKTHLADGILNIDFIAKISSPMINAIEIICESQGTGLCEILDSERGSTRPSGEAVLRVNCGAEESIKDREGNTWLPDQKYEEGKWGYIGGEAQGRGTYVTIKNTEQEFLYRSERWGWGGKYMFHLARGRYMIFLHFAETSPYVHRRVFSVNIQGKKALSDFAPTEVAGGRQTATVQKIPSVEVGEDGILRIDFTPSVQAPMINAIEIYHEDKGGV